MSWFQLDPLSIASRVRSEGSSANIPTLAASLARGIIGFTIVSVAGFLPWAIFGQWFNKNLGEVGLYLVCAAVFISLSGLLLHKLIIGAGSLSRFYKLFSTAFAIYSAAWITGWMLLRGYLHGHAGSIAGLFAGTALMGLILTRAFDAQRAVLKVIAALFLLNTLGYFAGGWIEGAIMPLKQLSILGLEFTKPAIKITAMLSWGVCYGAGFGAGLGLAFYICQAGARAFVGAQA